MFAKLFKKKQEGFTIIEVMIVLAIAGLIMVVVLIAVPQLQRSQRNEARRDVATRIVTEINNFAGNNNGNIPVANVASSASNIGSPLAATGFFNRYMGCTQASNVASCTTNINDPQTSFPVGTTTNGTVVDITAGAAVGSPGANAGSMYYGTSVVCSGESAVASTNARNFALLMKLEGGAVYCLDNK